MPMNCCVNIVYNDYLCVSVCVTTSTDIADAICFLLVGPSDLAAKSTVEVFTAVQSFVC